MRSAASAFGLGAGVSAQGVNARRFEDGSAIDDIATLNGIVASGRALMLDGLDDIGVADLGGPGGWYVPVRAKALYAGTQDIGEVLAAKAGLGVLPLAPFYVEGSSDPYILMAYLRDAGLLENAIERLAEFYAGEDVRYEPLGCPHRTRITMRRTMNSKTSSTMSMRTMTEAKTTMLSMRSLPIW